MAKKKTSAVLRSAPKVKFHAYLREPTVAPFVPKEDPSQIPYVYHGLDNLYPENLRILVDNCAPLERSITQLSEFVAGMGVRFYDKEGNEIKEAQAKFQEWMIDTTEEQFLAQTAYDLSHGLGMTWAVRRAAGGDIVRLDHRSRFGFRAAKTEGGKIPAMYWSNDWREAEWNTSNEKFKPVAIPTFDWTDGGPKYPEAIIFEKQYHPTEPVYGRVFWLGCKRAAEVWVKVDNYNRTQLDTGFAPAVMLGTRFDGTDAEIDKHEERIELGLTGSMGKGLLVFTMGPGEEEPFFQALPKGNHAGEIDEVRDGSAQVIYQTFGIPELVMQDKAEGLSSQERALAIRLQQLQRTVVSTLQKLPGRALTRLMNMAGIPVWETKFMPLEIFDPVQSEAILLASQTVDEAREQRGYEPLEDKEAGKMLLTQAAKLPSNPAEAMEIAKLKATAPVVAPGKNPQKEMP